jgi:hypothetical protein
VIHDILRLHRADAVFGNMLDVPGVPAELAFHEPDYTLKTEHRKLKVKHPALYEPTRTLPTKFASSLPRIQEIEAERLRDWSKKATSNFRRSGVGCGNRR